jgi:hypothetical protein
MESAEPVYDIDRWLVAGHPIVPDKGQGFDSSLA